MMWKMKRKHRKTKEKTQNHNKKNIMTTTKMNDEGTKGGMHDSDESTLPSRRWRFLGDSN